MEVTINSSLYEVNVLLIYLDVLMEPYGTVFPMSQALYEGSRVVIICHSWTTPKWSRYGNKVSNHIAINNVVIVQHITESDSGWYNCQGTLDSDGTEFEAMSEVLVGGTYTKCIHDIFLIWHDCH